MPGVVKPDRFRLFSLFQYPLELRVQSSRFDWRSLAVREHEMRVSPSRTGQKAFLSLSGFSSKDRFGDKLRQRESPDAASALRSDDMEFAAFPGCIVATTALDSLLHADGAIVEINILPTQAKKFVTAFFVLLRPPIRVASSSTCVEHCRDKHEVFMEDQKAVSSF